MTRLQAALSVTISAAALIAASLSGYAIGNQPDDSIVVMPCSAWADEQHPTIPPHTLTDACVDQRGTLHTAPTATENTR